MRRLSGDNLPNVPVVVEVVTLNTPVSDEKGVTEDVSAAIGPFEDTRVRHACDLKFAVRDETTLSFSVVDAEAGGIIDHCCPGEFELRQPKRDEVVPDGDDQTVPVDECRTVVDAGRTSPRAKKARTGLQIAVIGPNRYAMSARQVLDSLIEGIDTVIKS